MRRTFATGPARDGAEDTPLTWGSRAEAVPRPDHSTPPSRVGVEVMPSDPSGYDPRLVTGPIESPPRSPPAAPFPDTTVEQLVGDWAVRTPDAVAVRFPGGHWTYAALNAWANRLGHRLRGLGVGPGVAVGLCAERSPEAVAAALAVLKAGGGYLPLDPAYPRDRLAFMLDNARAPVLLIQDRTRGLLPAGPAEVVTLDADPAGPTHAPVPAAPADRLAYVIYTSGSTGRPKGIAMGQAALVNLLRWQLGDSLAGPGGRTLQFAPLSFDVSFQEIFSTWGSGGTLVLVSEALRRDPAGLADFLTREAVNRLFLPPVALRQLAEAVADRGGLLADLREVITAGEQLLITPGVADFFA